jgi:signal transduction histidine kinase
VTRVERQYGRLPISQATVMVNAALLAGVLRSAPGRWRAGWLALVLAVAGLRLVAWAAHRRRPTFRSPRGWSALHVAGAGLNGVLWGALPLVFFGSLDVAGHLFLSAVVIGMVAGSASSTLGDRAAFGAFAAPALAPLIVRLLGSPHALESAAGLLALVFAAAMGLLAETGARALDASLAHRFRNEALVEQLSAATQELSAANAGLEDRVRQRTGELVELERQLAQSALLASVGSLAAAVAHDINNPLASLLSGLRLLEQEGAFGAPLSPAAREGLDDVRTSAERVRDIVRSLGDVARVDGTMAPLELRAIVESCLAVASPELRGRVRVVRELADPGRVLGERGRLSQVFLGLILQVGRMVPAGDPAAHELRITLRPPGPERTVAVEIHCHPPPGDPAADGAARMLSLSPFHASMALVGGSLLARPDGSGVVVTIPQEPRPARTEGAGAA